jgi:hypothetical protein
MISCGMNFFSKLTSVIVVVVIIASANFLISHADMLGYGVWTGIRPIEDKIKKLEEFAKGGQVDAIALGSSICDFGFSAELYSKLMSEKLGRPYRVFNFSTGGAELITMPFLYRIARTAVKPKAIFLTIPVQFKRSEDILPNNPDYILSHAPIGAGRNDAILLQLSKFAWNLPIVSKSAALRDLIMFRDSRNLTVEGMDFYKVTAYGDRISYLAGTTSLDYMSRLRQAFEDQVKPMTKEAEQDLAVAQNTFFPSIDIKAMAELRKIALADDIKIYVLAHSSAAPLWMTPTANSEYQKGRAQYYDTLVKSVNGILLNPVDGLSVPDYGVMDETHLNTNGAHIYTRAVFQSAINHGPLSQPRTDEVEQVSLEPIRSKKDATFNMWSAVVLRDRGMRHKLLRCRFVESFAMPLIPPTDIFFALRMPDGREIVSPARKLKNGEYEADVDLGESDKKQSLILRLLYGANTMVPLNASLSSYVWVSAS